MQTKLRIVHRKVVTADGDLWESRGFGSGEQSIQQESATVAEHRRTDKYLEQSPIAVPPHIPSNSCQSSIEKPHRAREQEHTSRNKILIPKIHISSTATLVAHYVYYQQPMKDEPVYITHFFGSAKRFMKVSVQKPHINIVSPVFQEFVTEMDSMSVKRTIDAAAL